MCGESLQSQATSCLQVKDNSRTKYRVKGVNLVELIRKREKSFREKTYKLELTKLKDLKSLNERYLI